MPDFSFPAWLTQQHSFADSLLKGAQVGSIIANNRYRNQALAAQAIDAERNYALREKEISVRDAQQQAVAQARFDELEDMKTLSGWKPDQPLPSTLRTSKSLAMAADMQSIYSKSKAGRTVAAAEKDYHDRIEELLPKDALRVRDMLDQSGHMTAEIADFIEQAPKREKQFTPSSLEKDLNFMLEKGYITPETASTLATEKFLGPTETLEMSSDEQGRPMVRVIKGRSSTATGTPTVAVKTDLQKSINNTRQALPLMADLEKNLRAEDLGIRGVVGETVMDRLLPQFGADTLDPKRTDNRTKLRTLVQSMLRQISPDNRFTNEDRERIEKIMPDLGVLENVDRAKQVLSELSKVFSERNVRDMQALGSPLEMPQMSNDEIGAAVRMKLIDLEAAKQFLMQNR